MKIRKRKKWNEENIINELEKVIACIGHFPTKTELSNLGLQCLASAINRSAYTGKGYPYFQLKLGYKRKYMPDGYWTEDRIIEWLKRATKKYGRLPTNEELKRDAEFSSLLSAMSIKKGKNCYAKKLSLNVHKEKKGYWTLEKVLNRTRPICKKLGCFPTHNELKEMGEWTLSDKILEYGGSEHIAKILGFPLKYRGKLGGWSWTDIEKILREIILKIGEFPSTTWLCTNGYAGMANAIFTKYGGLEHVANRMGLNSVGHRKGYWRKWENIERAILKIMELTITFPNYNQIKFFDRRLTTGIKEFGGISEVAKRMGFNPPTQIVALDGHNVRSSYEFMLDNFLYGHGIKHSVDGYINKKISNFRYDFKIGNVFIEVWGFGNSESELSEKYNEIRKIKTELYDRLNLTLIGFEQDDFEKEPKQIEQVIGNKLNTAGIIIPSSIRKDYKIENLLRSCGYWTKERTIKELEKAIKRYGRFPKQDILRENALSSLEFAMGKYGGTNYFRKLLGYPILRSSSGHWTDSRIISKLKEVINRLEKFPSYKELVELGESKLASAIRHHGGYSKFQKILGYKSTKKPDMYWNRENTLREYEQCCVELGYFPTHRKLQSMKKSIICTSMVKHGGTAWFKNQATKKHPNILKDNTNDGNTDHQE